MTDADTLRMLEEAARSAIPFDAGRVRSGRDDKGTLDRKRWQSFAEQGWLGILVPEEQGGLALELDAATAVATVLGATAAPEPFVAAGVLAPMLLADCPASERRDEHLVSVVSGDRVTCLAWQDISGSLEIGAAELAAHQDGDGFTISGECRFVPVPDADAFLVAARSDGAPGLFWVARDAAGLTIDTEATTDGGAIGWLKFAKVAVAPGDRLAHGADVGDTLAKAIDYATLANCAELLGNMERCLELTLDYLKTRSQFGQQIGRFQVLQHRAVDLWMNKEVARHALTASLAVVMAPDVPAAARAQAASSAKARIAQTALALGNDAIQLHGAIGFTDEYDLALYVNRAITIAPYLGNAAEHLKRYGSLKQRRIGDAA